MNLNFFTVLSTVFCFVYSTLYFQNIQRNQNFVKGDLVVQISNKFYSIKSNSAVYEWFRSKSKLLCEQFLNASIFHGVVELTLTKELQDSVSVVNTTNCCELYANVKKFKISIKKKETENFFFHFFL